MPQYNTNKNKNFRKQGQRKQIALAAIVLER